MKLLFVTQESPVYLHNFLDAAIFTLIKSKHAIAGIVVLPSQQGKTINEKAQWAIRFYGIIGIARMLPYIMSEMIRGLFFKIRLHNNPGSIAGVISKYNIPIWKFNSVNSDDFAREIAQTEIDLLISIASPQIFSKKIIDILPKGIINYHSSLLPKYRGRQPLFWALLNQENIIGVSVHEVDDQLDNGPILTQITIPVTQQTTLHEAYLLTIKQGPDLLNSAVRKISKGENDRLSNITAKNSYNGKPTKNDLAAFRKSGRRIV